MAEQPVGAGLAECRDQARRVDLHLSRNDLRRKLDDVALLRLPDADHVWCTPLVLEGVTADSDGLRALLEFVDEPLPERL